MSNEKRPENNENLPENNTETNNEDQTTPEEDLSFESIFANLREKYHLNTDNEVSAEPSSDENDGSNTSPLDEDSELSAFFEQKSQEISNLDSSWDDTEETVHTQEPAADNTAEEKESLQENFSDDISSDSNAIKIGKPKETAPAASTVPWDEPFKIDFEMKKNTENPSIDTFEDISSGNEMAFEDVSSTSDNNTADEVPSEPTDISSQPDFSNMPATESAFFPISEQPSDAPKINSEDTPFISDLLENNIPASDAESGEEIMHFDMEENPEETKKKKKKKKKHYFFPHKGDSVGEIIRKIILIISILAIIGSGSWLLWDYVIQPAINDRINGQLSDLLVDSDTGKVVDDFSKLSDTDKEKTFASLKAINKDFVGWLDVDGAGLSLPVVQTTDNAKYLTTSFKGSFLASGTLFIDYRNNVPLLDRNTIIYGHHMYNGAMFGQLMKFKDVNAFKNHPLIKFHTIYGSYTYKIYGVFLTNSQAEDNNGYIFNYVFRNLTTENSFLTYIKEVSKRSLYTTGVDVESGDQLLTLSTCDRSIHNGRFVVVARLLRADESESIDTSKVSVNKSPLYPQVWYDKNKVTNPYKNAEKWFAE